MSDINPLFIDLVLEKILSFLNLSDLKQSRLVCHKWNEVAFKAQQKICTETILFGDSNSKQNLQTYVEAINSGCDLPFSNFRIQHSIFATQRSQTILNFFDAAAPAMQQLCITYQDGSLYYDGSHFNPSESLVLPNLVHLRFEVLPYLQEFRGSIGNLKRLKGEELFHQLLQMSKNLERVELVIPATDNLHVSTYLEAITEIEDHPGFREFVLNCSLTDKDIEILCRGIRSNRFTMMRISYKRLRCVRKRPHEFIALHAHTLRHLKVEGWPGQDLLRLPSLPNLETLEIVTTADLDLSSSRFNVSLPGEVNYAKTFPNLRRLLFQSYKWGRQFETLFLTSGQCLNLHEMKLPKRMEAVDLSLIITKVLPQVFPNIVNLELFISQNNVHTVSQIFCNLRNLRELSISFNAWNNEGIRNQYIDHIFTGIPESVCNELLHADADIEVLINCGITTGPSILDLKNLVKLQIRNLSRYGRRPQFTDITVYHALLHHPSLTTLQLWPSQISVEGIHQLRLRFKSKFIEHRF